MTNKNIDIKSMPYSIFTYVHHNKQLASMVKVHCQTDFALKTDEVKKLGERLAMQVVANQTLTPDDPWIHDTKIRVVDALVQVMNEIKETVMIGDIHLCK